MKRTFKTEYKTGPKDIARIEAVNGNEIETVVAIFANEKGNAQVTVAGRSDDILNALFSLNKSLFTTVKLPRDISRRDILEDMYKVIAEALDEKAEEDEEVDPELEELEKKLDDLIAFFERKNKEFEEKRAK